MLKLRIKRVIFSTGCLTCFRGGIIIKNFYAKLLGSKASPLLIFVFGILLQIITYLPLIFLAVNAHSNEQMSMVFQFLSVLWLFIPLVSIGAIAISITQLLRKEKSSLTVIGLILNMIWLVLFLCVLYLGLTVGSSI